MDSQVYFCLEIEEQPDFHYTTELLALRASGATPSYLSDTGTESSTTMPATGSKKQKKSKKPASSTHIPVAMPHLGTKIDMFLSSDDHRQSFYTYFPHRRLFPRELTIGNNP